MGYFSNLANRQCRFKNCREVLISKLIKDYWGLNTSLRLLSKADIASSSILKPTPDKAYIEFTLLHTLPFVNRNGRCISYRTLKNSVASAKDSLLNLNHEMADNPIEDFDHDLIIGHMVDIDLEELEGNPAVPKKKVPLKIIGCLYKRVKEVQKMLFEIEEGIDWKTSVEIGRDPYTDALFSEGKFIPVADNQEAVACIQSGSVSDYKGKKAALAWGGSGGEVCIWGGGFTLTPADKGAMVDNVVAQGFACALAEDSKAEFVINEKTYKCECIECGHTTTSKKHCKDLKCSECGGQMRRAERPGPGQAKEVSAIWLKRTYQ